MSAVETAVRGLCDQLLADGLPDVEAAQVRSIRQRLDGPLRIALAGRIKAGKSTLLNALVGERIAPTDAGECTRIVAWYQQGLGYQVAARMTDGSERPLPFHRNGSLEIDVSSIATDVDAERVAHLEVSWPSDRLATITLVDTPGLASLDHAVSARTARALGVDHDPTIDHGSVGTGGDADVVIYLMRHLHRVDASFLEGFAVGSDMVASPVNSIAVLSRADEVGAGRIDAMTSATRVAAAYARDRRVATVSSTVVAVAGLVAETAQTLSEHEFRSLRRLADLPTDTLTDLLLSVDRFVTFDADHVHDVSGVDTDTRQSLSERLGVFGLRFALDRLRSGSVGSTAQLSAELLRVSGIDQLRHELAHRIAPRAATLKARSALHALATVARRLDDIDTDRAARLSAEIERTIGAAHEFAELRLAHLVATGMTMLPDQEVARAERLTSGVSATTKLGVAADDDPGRLREAALSEIEHWRRLAASPALDPVTVEVCGIAARSAEGLFAAT